MEVAKYFLLGCVDSANLASGIRGERSEERKSWGWRFHNESGLELESEVCTGLCISVHTYLCVHECMCLCLCLSVCMYPCARVSMSSVHVLVCARARVCAHTCVFGGSASCCSAAQHLTPSHTIRGIPAIPATVLGKRFLLEGMGMFPFMVVSAAAAPGLASTCRYSLARLRAMTKHVCRWGRPRKVRRGRLGPWLTPFVPDPVGHHTALSGRQWGLCVCPAFVPVLPSLCLLLVSSRLAQPWLRP